MRRPPTYETRVRRLECGEALDILSALGCDQDPIAFTEVPKAMKSVVDPEALSGLYGLDSADFSVIDLSSYFPYATLSTAIKIRFWGGRRGRVHALEGTLQDLVMDRLRYT